MSAKHIHAWLQGPRPYAEGLKLLREHGELDDATLFFLGLGETSVSRSELEELMRALHAAQLEQAKELQARNMAPPPVTKATIAAERQQQARDPRTDGYKDAQLPPALALLYEEVKTWLREMDFYRHRLETLPSDDDRLRDALLIVELDERIVSAYARLDAWKATGNDPGAAPSAPTPLQRNAVELVQRLKTIDSYLSRARSGSRKVSPAKQALWKKEKDELKALIDALPA